MTGDSTALRTGPFVKGAFLCEQVIEGKDGANSYIRVIDQMGVETQRVVTMGQGQPKEDVEPALPADLPEGSIVEAWLVVMLACGGAQGRQSITLRMREPNGLTTDMVGPIDVTFDGRPQSGVNLHVRLRKAVSMEGHYSILVLMDRQDGGPLVEVTQIPFTVTYQRRLS